MGRIDSLRDASRRALWWASTPAGLGWLFFAGLVLRLVLARGGGFPFDMASFSAWADRLATLGPGEFYPDASDDYFVDYPPGYLYVLFALGKLSQLFGGGPPPVFLLKLPAILADLGVAWLAVLLARRLTPRSVGRRVPVSGIAAAAVLFNPAIVFVSAVWGQVDSVQALLVLGSFLLLVTGAPTLAREAGGLSLLAIAIGTKPQAAFVLPLVVMLLLWRHLRTAVAESRGGGSRDLTLAVVGAAGRIAGVGLIALAAALIMMAPFGLGLELRAGWPPVGGSLIEFYGKASQTYTVTSVFAFNLWGAVGFWRQDLQGDDVVRVLGVPALYVGLTAFAVLGAAVLWRAWRSLVHGELPGRVLTFGGAALVLVAFSVLTRIHERYLFLALVLLVPLVGYRFLRRSFVVLSVLYLVNIYFPYVYYLEFDGRDAPRIPGYDLLYGTVLNSPQHKALSLGTALVALFVAWRGWSRLREEAEVPTAEPDGEEAQPEGARVADADEELARPRRPWTLVLHPVGSRGAALGAVAFVVALAIRLPGLGAPEGMYFDEVYHARTAGEYLQEKEVYEWTHPPLAKELMAVSIATLGGTDDVDTGPLPDGMRTATRRTDASAGSLVAARDDGGVVWGEGSGTSGQLLTGRFGEECRIDPASDTVALSGRPTAVSAVGDGAYVGAVTADGPAVVRVDGGRERWQAPLPAVATDVAALGNGAFVVTADGGLHLVGPDGATEAIATGAAAVEANPRDDVAWVSFPQRRQVVSYGTDGASRTTVTLEGRPGALGVPPGASRVLVDTTEGVESVDTEAGTASERLTSVSADAFGSVPGTGLAWAAEGRSVRVVEPRGMSVIGTAALPAQAAALVGDDARSRVVAVTQEGLACMGGSPAFAWRFGSAVFGAAMVALVALIALRLFGSVLLAALASAFLAVDGLAYTLARIAMNDSYVTAFVLAAWFCALGVLYRWGRGVDRDAVAVGRSRGAAIAWLAATGLALGAAVGSKWVGLYALAGVGALFAWDMLSRRWDGVLSLAGRPAEASASPASQVARASGTLALFAVLLLAVPAGIYVATYVPYFRLGHSLSEFFRLQQGMYGYHAHLTADHPYGSPWYGWPAGHRPVWLYLGDEAGRRAEIWTVGNPVVFLGGLLGMGIAATAAWRRRSAALAVVVVAALVQYLPWTTVSRVTFLYHYLPVVPFLAVALAWWLVEGRAGAPRRRGLEVAVVGGAAAVAFVWLLPILDGWFVPTAYLDAIKSALFWMF